MNEDESKETRQVIYGSTKGETSLGVAKIESRQISWEEVLAVTLTSDSK